MTDEEKPVLRAVFYSSLLATAFSLAAIFLMPYLFDLGARAIVLVLAHYGKQISEESLLSLRDGFILSGVAVAGCAGQTGGSFYGFYGRPYVRTILRWTVNGLSSGLVAIAIILTAAVVSIVVLLPLLLVKPADSAISAAIGLLTFFVDHAVIFMMLGAAGVTLFVSRSAFHRLSGPYKEEMVPG